MGGNYTKKNPCLKSNLFRKNYWHLPKLFFLLFSLYPLIFLFKPVFVFVISKQFSKDSAYWPVHPPPLKCTVKNIFRIFQNKPNTYYYLNMGALSNLEFKASSKVANQNNKIGCCRFLQFCIARKKILDVRSQWWPFCNLWIFYNCKVCRAINFWFLNDLDLFMHLGITLNKKIKSWTWDCNGVACKTFCRFGISDDCKLSKHTNFFLCDFYTFDPLRTKKIIKFFVMAQRRT